MKSQAPKKLHRQDFIFDSCKLLVQCSGKRGKHSSLEKSELIWLTNDSFVSIELKSPMDKRALKIMLLCLSKISKHAENRFQNPRIHDQRTEADNHVYFKLKISAFGVMVSSTGQNGKELIVLFYGIERKYDKK